MNFSPHKRRDPGLPLAGEILADGRPTAPLGSRHGRGWVGDGGHLYSFVNTPEGPLLYKWDGEGFWLPFTAQWDKALKALEKTKHHASNLRLSLAEKAYQLVQFDVEQS